jgi:hypothetical protein
MLALDMSRSGLLVALGLALLLFLTALVAKAETALGLNASSSFDDGAAAYGVHAARRGQRFGLALQAEHCVWWGYWQAHHVSAHSFQAAVGGEAFFIGGRLVSALYAGISTLLFNTVLDDAGTTGLFFDIRPLGYRFPLRTSRWTVILHPLQLTLLAPVMTGLPLLQVQYRTSLELEYRI